MSEQYLVSARKYRPQTFDTVVGQSHITTTLKNAISSNHLAHAFLFCGPRGVGKTTCARILAKTINCLQPTSDIEACGTCEMCLTFNENASFNVFELDAASNNSVDDIRALSEQVRFAPQMGKYKVYIIDEVHMLSTNAFNAFLKTLEEPPSYAIFILATTEKHKILPTILSRCQIFDFKRIQSIDIVNHLIDITNKEGVSAEESGLHIIAQKSEGCMRDALSMMDRIASFSNGKLTYEQTIEHLNILDAGFYFKILDALLTTNIADVLLLLDDVYKRGFEGDAILNGFSNQLRNLLLCKDPKMTRLLDLPEAHKRAFFEKSQMLSMSFITSALNILNDAESNYKVALNKRLHLEVSFLKICYLPHVLNTSSLEDEKKKYSVTAPVSSETIAKPKSNDTQIIEGFEKTVKDEAAAVEASIAPKEPVSVPKIVTTQEIVSNNTNTTLDTTKEAIAPPPLPKLGKNFLKQIQEQAVAQDAAQEVVTLSQEVVEKLYNDFVLDIKNNADKQLQATNLAMAKVEWRSEYEIAIITNTQIGQMYVSAALEGFKDYCKSETKNHDLIIFAELDSSLINQSKVPQRLSKTELFNQYVQLNPIIKRFKDELRLDLK